MLGGPVQIAYAVNDVVAAAQRYAAKGIGPFFVREHIPVSAARVRDEPIAFYDHSSAYGQWGSLMVELICEHHSSDSRVGPAQGLHHMAFFVDEFEHGRGELIKGGWAELLYAKAGGTPFSWHDADADLGHLVEIYERNERLVRFYDMVRSAAADWDGSNPVRAL